jgi:hypothetical protein
VLRGSREVALERVDDPGGLPRTRDPMGLIFLHGDTVWGRIPWGVSSAEHPLEVFRIYRFGD